MPKTINSKGNYRGIKSKNRFEFTDEYVIGYTNRGERFYFDLDDYDKVKDHYWFKDNNGYIISRIYDGKKLVETLRLHRVVMNMPKYEQGGLVVDHIHHIKYDNRKSQLRITDNRSNVRNRGRSNGQTRKYEDGLHGVYYYKSVGKYSPQIWVDGKNIYLGYFDTPEEALKVRKEAEEKYYGEFRFVDDEEEFEILPP